MNIIEKRMAVEAEAFDALAHPERIKIVGLLQDGEACVCHIQAMLGKRQAYISQHLNVLKQAGLVISRKDGQRTYYQISDSRWYNVIEQVQAILVSEGRLSVSEESELASSLRTACHCPQCLSQLDSPNS